MNNRVYVENCEKGCPPDPLCASFGGLCADRKQSGNTRCLNSGSYSRTSCTCAQNGGIFMPPSQCRDQCGAAAVATDAPTGGSTLADVCCIPLFQCPDYHKYECTDGSATFLPQCLGNGTVICGEGQTRVSV